MCGMGGFVLSLIFLTLVYPAFCNRVSEVKQTKVREYMQDRYGVDDASASILGSGWNTELSKAAQPDSAAQASGDIDAHPADTAEGTGRGAAPPDYDQPLPPAKRR